MQGRRLDSGPRFTPHGSRSLETGRERRRWSRIVRRSRMVNVEQAPRQDPGLIDMKSVAVTHKRKDSSCALLSPV
jgi:hypothetical protein